MLLMCIASVIWGAFQPTVAALNSVPLHRRVNKSSHLTVPDYPAQSPKYECTQRKT
jgi:hypothetical protein